MNLFNIHISSVIELFFTENKKNLSDYLEINKLIKRLSGISDFFDSQIEANEVLEKIAENKSILYEPDRGEYGDFQTNIGLAIDIATYLRKNSINPKVIIEPTCGKGNFIIASLMTFNRIEKISAVEIYKPYVWETKFNILKFFIDNPFVKKPEINIFHCNVYDFDFMGILKKYAKEEILVIGNPPWVTNSKLSALKSSNLPKKSNFKKHTGFDAITGKGNFDIGEFITLIMLDAFQDSNGHLAFLLKNSVIKNVIFDQKQHNYKISSLQKFSINSKKEFNVSVEASLLLCKLNHHAEFICTEFDFYCSSKQINEFGWVSDKFVSNIPLYQYCNNIEGLCQFEWRQGVKHDLSSYMEFERINGHFINGLDEEIYLEDDLVFGILKSSDLKQSVIDKTRKYTIITQKKVGQDTIFIKKEYPKTYSYLNKNKSHFDLRKSSIYKGKPDYSIFGIGEYSFKPFKITISGLYKNYFFNLVLPQKGKPIMLDDTCYFIGFDQIEFAAYTYILLNCDKTKKFLQAITFPDAKRTFTKEVLMRIDLKKLAMQFSGLKIQDELDQLNEKYDLNIKLNKWNEYVKLLEGKDTKPTHVKQLTLLESKEKYKRASRTSV